jgi:Protein of unknown function (DUF3047)
VRAAIFASMLACAAVARAAPTAAPAGELPITKFSTAELGAVLPEGWEKVELPYGKKNDFEIVADGPSHALQVRADASFGSAAYRTSEEASATPIARWRWKIDHVLEKARMDTKAGEDFAARMYVSFDLPVSELSSADRVKLGIAGAAMGFVPAAAICYVWDNRNPVGTSRWSPYFGHVRVIVLESGSERAGQWVDEKRDVEADFVEAFGQKWKGRVPKITGVVAGNDTDQTGESVTTWFGDVHLEPRP